MLWSWRHVNHEVLVRSQGGNPMNFSLKLLRLGLRTLMILGLFLCLFVFFFFFFFFGGGAAFAACRSSQARDQTHTTARSLTTEPPGNSRKYVSTGCLFSARGDKPSFSFLPFFFLPLCPSSPTNVLFPCQSFPFHTSVLPSSLPLILSFEIKFQECPGGSVG